MSETAGKSRSGAGQDELVFAALGGLGEIGMNVYLYGYGPPAARQWLLVDLGITFPDETEPGADVVLPDLSFIEKHRKSLAGIVLTHAHEDHVGAVIELWPRLRVPIYASPFTAGMVKAKSTELMSKGQLPIREIPLGGRFTAGPFDVEFVTMAHSIPEPSALAIRTPAGLVLHTGDWKLDRAPYVGEPTDESRLKVLGEEGVLAMVCDSTNAMREGRSPSETDVARSIADIIKGAKRRVAITTFSSNVARIKAVADAADACGRRLIVSGRALHRVIDVAIETGYLPETFSYLDQNEARNVAARDACILCTGSQGESRAAVARIADNEHPAISLAKGDLMIFSSRTIPGNEKPVGRIQNALARMGVELVTDNEALVHVTGHPRREELREMYSWIKPRIVVPMHGESRHLRENGKLATACGVPEVVIATNGDLVRLASGQAKVVGQIPTGRSYRDGQLIVPAEDGPVRQRRKLAVVGIAVVALTLSVKGEVLGDTLLTLDGIPEITSDGATIYDATLDVVDDTLDGLPAGRRRDIEVVREAIRKAVRAEIAQAWGKKPIVKVLINVVGK
jgi:ribonuclease J